jgi:hypothetical protein
MTAMHQLPLPVCVMPKACFQHDERVGVRGSGRLQGRRMWLPLTLTLSPLKSGERGTERAP